VAGGVLQRTGHTEGSVDLARLAGCEPAGVICEIMNDDGTMARMPDLTKFAAEHKLRILSIADLIQYRLRTERLVRRLKVADLRLPGGNLTWRMHVYETVGDYRPPQNQMLAATLGEIDASPTLVRVQVGSLLGDVFGARAKTRIGAAEAIRRIEQEGRGVMLYIPQRFDLASDLAYHLGETVMPPRNSEQVSREIGFGSQVLMDLGIRKMRLLTNQPRKVATAGYELEVVEEVLMRNVDEDVPGVGATH